MKLLKIIEKCDNAQDVFTKYDLEELKEYKYIVKGKSKFFSGWWRAQGVSAYDLVLCKDDYQAAKIMQGLKKANAIYIKKHKVENFRAIDNKNIYTFRIADNCKVWL